MTMAGSRRPVPPGHVFLVGAGPGDPDLLTLRGAAVLHAADAVFHDRLVSPELIDMVREGAELIDVGHRSGEPRHSIEEVVERMAERARRGEVVARLKGGDPYVFGRGGEEVLGLLERRVPFEVVPGVTSAVAGPSAAGIPVTHRGVATSVLIVTGHDQGGQDHAWEHLRADTLVVLMGSTRLADLSESLIAAGWDPATPAAVVMAATTPRQRQVRGPLAGIGDQAEAAGLRRPALLVVGQVVGVIPEPETSFTDP
jgi:uroporphyrin-III C-methyltransferase